MNNNLNFDANMEAQFNAIFGTIEEGIKVNYVRRVGGKSKEKSRTFRTQELAKNWVNSNVEDFGAIAIVEMFDMSNPGVVVATNKATALNYLGEN